MAFGDGILAIINFLSHPYWHLVVFFIVLSLLVAWGFYDKWFNKNAS